MKVKVEYDDAARGQMHRLIYKLQRDIDALGVPIRVYSRYRIVGTDGREILATGGAGPQLMEPVSKAVRLMGDQKEETT